PEASGIVKLPLLGRINVYSWSTSPIPSRCSRFPINDVGPAGALPVYGLGKTRCEPVTKNDRLDLNLGIIGVSHYLHELPLWSRHGRTISGNLCGDDFALFGFRRGWLQRDSRADARIHRNEITPA